MLFPEDAPRPVAVSPRAGDALVFAQSFKLGRRRVKDSQYAMRHEGTPLVRRLDGGDLETRKYVLRSDVLYRIPDDDEDEGKER